MTSSTVAITLNQAAAPSLALDSNTNPSIRKRNAAVTEKRLNIESGSDGGISGGKDLSRSVRGKTALEKPNNSSQPPKVSINSTISPRGRKAFPKSEKPKWKTVLSVLTKNLVLLLVITVLSRAIWKWAKKSNDRISAPVDALDFQGQISDVESFLKLTAKMMQVQIEVVDKKIENEIGSLRRELEKKVEEKGAFFEKELKRLGDRADILGESLDEVKNTGFFSKKEFESFANELKNRGQEGGEEGFSLDRIRAVARDIVMKEIEKHAADGLGRVDYALASSGASVVRHSEPFYHDSGISWLPAVRFRNGVHFLAQKMLEPSFGEPGDCFPLKGSSGFVEVRLRTAIIPEAITLEHVAKIVAYDRSTAPKDCRISAWFEGPDGIPSGPEVSLLADFTYDLEKSNAQTFDVEFADSSTVDTVRLDFTSNHGSPLLTCIYRLRVHGHEPESVALLGANS
ncbi:hypothetical protein MRB53_008205 [Persea americana]|uniref:Uncharacterized protein n=1 Tax=Persea americana TaxID=3435 RepID=A0ACC2MMT0_PERAE|nr:hypothetical protein MRB53_008205 [Persea americana]